ncbi:MAG: exodeoxyribonuclease VII small subunit [Deltaproteobacteria bacterium]|nr:exodeoxyribonuclease VII small subunit [Deltaproteobacteria bacterium]
MGGTEAKRGGRGVAKEVAKREKDRELGYEEVIGRLEEIVQRLEAGNLPLEESLKAFEEGVGLVRLGEAKLNEAEKRVEQLLSTPQGDRAVPLEEAGREAPRRSASRPVRSAPEGPEEPPPPDDADIPF